ncbi:hypothetical protein AZA_72988 [Nitrospirillum viridazoti Y2]|nr:hypothetical protein AZA_72988 [Nitrospirillum amazonense Y2]
MAARRRADRRLCPGHRLRTQREPGRRPGGNERLHRVRPGGRHQQRLRHRRRHRQRCRRRPGRHRRGRQHRHQLRHRCRRRRDQRGRPGRHQRRPDHHQLGQRQRHAQQRQRQQHRRPGGHQRRQRQRGRHHQQLLGHLQHRPRGGGGRRRGRQHQQRHLRQQRSGEFDGQLLCLQDQRLRRLQLHHRLVVERRRHPALGPVGIFTDRQQCPPVAVDRPRPDGQLHPEQRHPHAGRDRQRHLEVHRRQRPRRLHPLGHPFDLLQRHL